MTHPRILTTILSCALASPAVAAVQGFENLSGFSDLTPNAGTHLGTASIQNDIVWRDGVNVSSQILRITGGVFVSNPSDSIKGGAWCSALTGMRPGAYAVTVRYDDRSQRYFNNAVILKPASASGLADESGAASFSIPGARGYRTTTLPLTLDAGEPIIQLAGWGNGMDVRIDEVVAYRSEAVVEEDFTGFASFAELTPNAGSFNGSGTIAVDSISGAATGPVRDSNVVVLRGGTPVAGPPSASLYGGAWFTAVRDLPAGSYDVTVRYVDVSGKGLSNSLLIKRATAAGTADEASTQVIKLSGFCLLYTSPSPRDH
jgi:hypothetical protein